MAELKLDLPECVEKTVENVASEPAKEIGNLFGDIIYTISYPAHLMAGKLRIKQKLNLERFEKELQKKMDEKPQEVLVEPRLQVVGQAIEDAKFCVEEEMLREMFENLIANSADYRFQRKIHPSFSAILKQMSPLDAENLLLFKENMSLPIVKYEFVLGNGSLRTEVTNCFLENDKMQGDDCIELQAESIAALAKAGLVTIEYGPYLAEDGIYNRFEETNIAKAMREEVVQPPVDGFHSPQDDEKIKEVKINKGIVKTTPLGSAFIKVCFEC